MQKTRDQIRAGLVYTHIQQLASDEAFGKKYGSLALSAPALIRSAGLLQALAFYEAKREKPQEKFVENIELELRSPELGLLAENEYLRAYAVNCDLITYMRLTREVLALCQWHKRFAQSILKIESGGNEP